MIDSNSQKLYVTHLDENPTFFTLFISYFVKTEEKNNEILVYINKGITKYSRSQGIANVSKIETLSRTANSVKPDKIEFI